MPPQSKRRRISSDDDDEQPSDEDNDEDNRLVVLRPVVGFPMAVDIDPTFDNLSKIIMVDLHKDNVEEVVDSLEHLLGLFKLGILHDEDSQGVKNRTEAVSLGVISTLVATMKKWPEDVNVQMFGCLCLAILAHSDLSLAILTHSDLPAKVLVARLGGVEAAVGAMIGFPQIPEIQFASMALLTNVLDADDDAEQPRADVTKRFVEEFNGVALVVEAMEASPDDDQTQLCGCALIHIIARCESYRNALLEARAASAVAKAAQQHPDGPINAAGITDILLHTCGFFANMQEHAGNSEIQEALPIFVRLLPSRYISESQEPVPIFVRV